MEETLEIRYLVKAVDQATSTLQKIDQNLGSVKKSIEDSEKASRRFEKQNESLGQSFTRLTTNVENITATIKRFYDFFINLDFKKIIRALTIIGLLLKLRGFDTAGNLALKMAGKVDVLATSIGAINGKLEEMQEKYGSVTGALLHATGIDAAAKAIGGFAVETAKFIAIWGTLGTLLISSRVFLKSVDLAILGVFNATTYMTDGVIRLTSGWHRLHVGLIDVQTFINNRLLNTLIRTERVQGFLNSRITGFVKTTKNATVVTGAVGKTIGKAALSSELFEKGIFGVATRLTAMGTGLVSIGRLLASTDSMILKIAGVSMVALSAAIFGLGTVLRSFVVTLGEAIQSLGTKMVGAVQESVKIMNKLKDSTFTFTFIVQRLNEETRGATGAVEEWNKELQLLSETTGYATSELQMSTSELLRVGHSLGLTKDQMKSLLPIIADLAAANHKDLFQSTLAVVEALGGQTVMLQNMGVSLTQHAIAETHAAEQLDKRITKLSDSEKIQLRYNALLEKTVVTQGIAAATLATSEGATRQMTSAIENMNKSFGEGAEVIESFFNRNMAVAVSLISDLSSGVLELGGFLTASLGRVLQVVGAFIKWSFAIVLVGTSIKALNILLANQSIANFVIRLSQAELITKSLAASMPRLSAAISASLLKIGTAGLTVNSVFGLMKVSLIAVTKAAWAMLAPFVLIAAKIAVVVGVFYLIYQALKRLDDQTKIFTNTWRAIMRWLEESSEIITVVKSAISDAALAIQTGLISTIFGLSKLLVKINLYWLDFKLNLLQAKNAVIEFGTDLAAYLQRAPAAILRLLGVQSAYASELEKTAKINKQVSSQEDEKIAAVKRTIEERKKLVSSLDAAKEAEIAALTESNERTIASEGKKREEHKKTFSLIAALNEARKAIAKEEEELGKIEAELKNVEELQVYEKFLSDKELLKLVYQARELESENKHSEALEKMMEFRRKLEEKHLKQKEGSMKSFFSLERNAALAEQKWEKATFKERLGTMRDTFNNIVSLSNAKNSSLRAIGKAAAVTTATIDGVLAVQKTLSSVPYPFSIPLAAAVGAAAAANVARISGLATFREGGIVDGPKAGDQTIVRANGDEMFLTKAQQTRLFNMINKGGTGNNEDISNALSDLADAIRQRPVILEANGRELAKVVRDQRDAGVRI